MERFFIPFEVTPELLSAAESRVAAHQKDKHFNGSIMKGEGTLAGYIGELALLDILGASHVSCKDYDLLYNRLRLEVKTHITAVKPHGKFEIHLSDWNTKQNCDFYVWVFLLRDNKFGWVTCACPKAEFMPGTVFKKKGEKFSNGFTVTYDCHLKPMNTVWSLDRIFPDFIPKEKSEADECDDIISAMFGGK